MGFWEELKAIRRKKNIIFFLFLGFFSIRKWAVGNNTVWRARCIRIFGCLLCIETCLLFFLKTCENSIRKLEINREKKICSGEKSILFVFGSKYCVLFHGMNRPQNAAMANLNWHLKTNEKKKKRKEYE